MHLEDYFRMIQLRLSSNEKFFYHLVLFYDMNLHYFIASQIASRKDLQVIFLPLFISLIIKVI